MKKRKLKIGDRVIYTILGDTKKEWEITGMFAVTEGTMVCLLRPELSNKSKIERCNAEINDLEICTK